MVTFKSIMCFSNFRTVSVMLFLSMVFVSCSSDEADFLDEEFEDEAELADVEISEEIIDNLIQSIPSPIEMTTLIKESGGDFNSQFISKTKNLSRFRTKYDKAINMGIYVSDLGYINIYEKTMYSIDYLDAIRTLADDLKIGQFFDFKTLRRLSKNSDNVDSLIFISTTNFNKMDKFLREQKRSELSVLMITGAWLEGLHIACQVAKVTPNSEIYERIGEQKMNIDNLALMLQAFQGRSYFERLAEQLNELKEIYKGVTISYEYGDPVMEEVDGQLVIVDNTTSVVDITSDQVSEITLLIENIRKEITKV